MFICAKTKLNKCQSLGDQVRVIALRRRGGWETCREDLAKIAEDWFGREPARTKDVMRSVVGEVFRVD